jgi:hypothetical protein
LNEGRRKREEGRRKKKEEGVLRCGFKPHSKVATCARSGY